jgi:hypothetical protein
MKHILQFSSVALLLAACVTPVFAQDSSSQASSASSEASSAMTSSSSSSQMSSEEVGSNINYGQVISAIQAGKNADLSTITESSTINFVLVSDLKANGNTNALDNALEKNADQMGTLKANVDVNAALSAKLTAAGYTSNQVVAVLSNDDGSFTVVINDEHP